MRDSLRDRLVKIADWFADAKSHDLEQTILEAVERIDGLTRDMNTYRERAVWRSHGGSPLQFIQGSAGEHETNEPITAETANTLVRALDIYERERARFRHARPEITGAYFLTGGHGDKDANQLPQFVGICPAYGAGWEQIYERTERTVSYEGS